MHKKPVGLLISIIFISVIFQVRAGFAQTIDERIRHIAGEVVKGDYDATINDANEVLKIDAGNALAFEYRVWRISARRFNGGD